MRKLPLYCLMCWTILLHGLALAATSDVVLQDQTIQDGEIKTYYGYNSLTAGPNFVMEPGSDVTLQSSGKVILAPGFQAKEGSRLVIEYRDIPPISFTGSADFITTGGTVTLTWDAGADNPDTTLLPGVGVVSAIGSIDVTPSVTTTYTLQASRGATVLEETFTVTVDGMPPVVSNSYPQNNSQINAFDAQSGLSVTFTDDTGITDVKLFKVDGQDETDITSQATVNQNAINFDLTNLDDGNHTLKVVATDKAGNQTEETINIELDTTAPVTTASIGGGSYSDPFTVDLTTSEPATIFYTVNGSVPYEADPNTLFSAAPVQGVNIDHTMTLQFFAKDAFGNLEPLNSLIYTFNDLPESVTGLSAAFNDPNVNLSWDSMLGADKYRVYRALSPVDADLLEQSAEGGYAPPQSLRYSAADLLAGTTNFQDGNTSPGITYHYGVTQIDSNGIEGPIGQVLPLTVPVSGSAQSIEEAKAMAFAWLAANQDKTGAWGNNHDFRILATSQVLSAYAKAGKDDYATHKGLFFLRGNKGKNNDLEVRRNLALSAFGHNIEAFVSKHITMGIYSYETYLNGWGINHYYVYDPVDTALGMKLMARSTQTFATVLKNHMKLTTMDNIDSRFGWVNNGSTSIFVSALVYGAEKELKTTSSYDPAWILTSQSTTQDPTEGSFNTGVADTAAVILWIDTLSAENKVKAQNYLVRQQNPDGSWGDAFITGLCLEALHK